MALSFEDWQKRYSARVKELYSAFNSPDSKDPSGELEEENLLVRIGTHQPVKTFEERFDDAQSLFQQISKMPTFTTLDSLFPEPFLLTGCLTLLHTPDKAGRGYLIQLFIQLMVKYYTEGVVFIDCTNVFPAYELIEATIEKEPLLDPQLPIRAVQLSRSFNYHQATETVKEQLEPLLKNGFTYNITNEFAETQESRCVKPKLIIVAGLPDLYLNAESAQYLEYDKRPSWWSILELQETLGYLTSLSMQYNCATIITASSNPLSKTKSLGGKYINQSATVIVKVKAEGLALYGELIKHPFMGSKEVLLQLLKRKGKKGAMMPLKYYCDRS